VGCFLTACNTRPITSVNTVTCRINIAYMSIRTATSNDIPALDVLVNSAYRGDSSRQGWTTEADFLDGIRTDADSLQEMMQQPGTVILVLENENGVVEACVYLKKENDKMYLGMLTVSPVLQGKGTGKVLLRAAEQYAQEQGCIAVTMTVISIRHELIAWYERHGYHNTGETKPFPTDVKFGIPKQPLEFIVMEKRLG
jgi:N-acetylglutamate synthase-like GNAT family acetyltransferase